jgi:ABC-type uncharacterized transport system involved in gliding motility auxiliary subunit
VTRKIIDNLGSVGLILALLGLFNYYITNLWDWKSQAGVYTGVVLLVVYLILNHARVTAALSTRSARLGGAALATLILVLGILALLNFLNFRNHKRIDLSEGRVNALSDQTRRVLGNLDQNIEVVGFFQSEERGRRFQNLIREYRFVSSLLNYEIVDPQKEPAKVAQFEVTRDGQVVVSRAGKREVVEDATEENLTNAIIKVTREGEKKVYFLTGHGERSIDDSDEQAYSTVRQGIERQNYLVESYNLAQENRIPEDAAVIVSAGPRVSFFPNEVELLDEYLASGGKFLLLVDPESEFSMDEWLSRYGVGLNDDYVVDASGLGQLFGFGAGAPLASDYADHPATRELANTMTIFPGSRSVTTVDSSLDYSTTVLVRTSPQSWGETQLTEGGGRVAFDEGVDHPGPLAIAVAAVKQVEGDVEPEKEENAESDEEAETSDASEEPEVERESRFVLFGDADFASNGYARTAVNSDLFLNAVSWLAEDTDLLSIRPRDPENRSLTLTAAENRLVFWATVVLFPLVTLILGVGVWYRRR